MNTKIRNTKTIDKISDIVLFVPSLSKLPKGFLNGNENRFIKEQLKKDPEKNFFHINRFTSHVFVCIASEKNADEEFAGKQVNRITGSKITAVCKTDNIDELTVISSSITEEDLYDLLEGMMLSVYSFEKYKSKPNSGKFLSKISLNGITLGKNKLFELEETVDAVFMARNWVNEPGSSLRPVDFASQVSELFSSKPEVKVEILSPKKIATLKMAGIQAVSKGGPNTPAFIILEYLPAHLKNINPIVLVGKGIFFDTGGINLKPGTGLADMKCDMSGAAAVASAMYLIASLKPEIPVVGLIPATENRPGHLAYLPGDVLTMMNGVTVEVKNTDAEGRLILADALCYAKKYIPALVVSIATLTGSAHATFGPHAIAGMQNNAQMYFSLMKSSGFDVFERIAELPMWKDYEEMIESQVADIQNVGGPYAGAVTAAKFLQKFTDYAFIHLDIAGPAFIEKASGYQQKGGTGVGVRLFADFVMKMEKVMNA